MISGDSESIELRHDEILELDFLLSWGKGEVLAEKGRDPGLPRGWIPLSRSHSPVRRIDLNTVPIEEGPHHGSEQLIAEITTDGSVSPEDALRRAGARVTLPQQPWNASK
jgi:DNA-directed RNA polymerase subunit alpha